MNGYIGVNNIARKISKMYIGIDNLARKVTKAYVGVNGVARQWYSSGYPDPPTEYEFKQIGTWSSTSDVDTFLSTYTPENGYSGLKLGNYIEMTVPNTSIMFYLVIAGFNCEVNATASDGTVYNNGYGIMIAAMQLPFSFGSVQWHTSASSATPYKNSYIHSYLNSTLYNNMTGILGNHIVNRNVLLGSSCDSNTWQTNAYTWTTSYLTLMSIGQYFRDYPTNFGTKMSKYDDGEANYKLPGMGVEIWGCNGKDWVFRNVYGKENGEFYVYYGVYGHPQDPTNWKVTSPAHIAATMLLR